VLTHRVWGLVVFVLVMAVVFDALFAWSEPVIAVIEDLVAYGQSAAEAALPAGPIAGLVSDGIIAGVGNVVVFVPQIALLFLFISFLEDSGYLARVAFVIDRIMGGVGLHGRAFVPMLSGFACAVPAVMATRTLESRRDRLLTMLAIPFTSCSARLPIYVLVIAVVFPANQRVLGVLSLGGAVLLAMYLLSVGAALTAAAVLRRTVLRGPRPTLLLELPPYRMPLVRNVLRQTWQRVKRFLVDAGTIILAFTIVLWALLSFPKDDSITARYDGLRAAVSYQVPEGDRPARLSELDGQEAGEQLRQSAAGRLGRAMEPALEPLGMDWRIGIGIIGAFAAREVFVSTLGIVFGIGDADEETAPLRSALRDATWPDGRPVLTPLSGVALMVFFVLACQCMSTVAVVRRESGGWKWPLFMVTTMTAIAYTAALLVFQLGSLLGLGGAS
jgi:ferrous iron transport protein B